MNASKLIILLSVFIMMTTVVHGQNAKNYANTEEEDTVPTKANGKKAKPAKKEKVADTVAATSDKAEGKKGKAKKEKDNTVKLDSTSTRADSIKASLPKALKNAKPEKPPKPEKEEKPKPVKKSRSNLPEGSIIPGAEEKANAETKDKLDRTMKGPSGQRVYVSPNGGRYYFDANGNKKFLRNDSPKEK